jgi:hypothetical protein
MNVMQRLVLFLGTVAVVGMGVYPPWVYTTKRCLPGPSRDSLRAGEPIRISQPAGYFLITRPPVPPADQVFIEVQGVEVDATRLAFQEAIAVMATVMGVLMFKKAKPVAP